MKKSDSSLSDYGNVVVVEQQSGKYFLGGKLWLSSVS